LSEPAELAPLDDLEVRAMTVNDLDQVMEIERVSFPTPWSRAAYHRELTDNAYARYVVATRDGQVVGYAGMWVLLEEAHVTNIAVHPRYRRRGLGETLMRELMRLAREAGASRMTLEVRPSNSPAQRLYAKLGFHRHGIRRRYYSDTKEDAIVMWHERLEQAVSPEGGPSPGPAGQGG